MAKAKIVVGLTVVLTIVFWVAIRPSPRAISAPPTVTYDAFTEDNAAHRFATNQPRHWRQMLIQR